MPNNKDTDVTTWINKIKTLIIENKVALENFSLDKKHEMSMLEFSQIPNFIQHFILALEGLYNAAATKSSERNNNEKLVKMQTQLNNFLKQIKQEHRIDLIAILTKQQQSLKVLATQIEDLIGKLQRYTDLNQPLMHKMPDKPDAGHIRRGSTR